MDVCCKVMSLLFNMLTRFVIAFLPGSNCLSLVVGIIMPVQNILFSLVQFSHSVMSNSLWLHGMQHARPPCPSPTPRVYTNSCPLSQWCHPTVSFSVITFSAHLQSFPAIGSFQMSQFFTSGGQSTQASASAPVLPMNNQDLFPLGCICWISLSSKGCSMKSK